MLTGRPIPDTSIFEIEYSGRLDAADFERLRDELAAFLAAPQAAGQPADVLARYADIELGGIQPKALWEDFRSIGLEREVRRAALLTDQGWLAGMARTAAMFIEPELKVFGADERDAAVAWLQRA